MWRFEVESDTENMEGGSSLKGADATGLYSQTQPAAEAIIESPTEEDVFYVASGMHGKAGTWHIYSVDMRRSPPKVSRLAPIPPAAWLNGGTSVPHPTNPLILMA